jgi:hypothetical protein
LFLSFSSSSDQQNVLLRHLDLNPTFLRQPFFSEMAAVAMLFPFHFVPLLREFHRISSQAETSDLNLSDEEGRSVDQMKRKMTGTNAGDDLIEPKQNSEFEQKVKRLHEEYNALMDRYRRLKQMALRNESHVLIAV